MSKATDDLMDSLHRLTAETLADIIKNGVETTNKDGEVIRVTAPAAYLAAAIKFLKDNDITADAGSDRFDPLKGTISNVPVFDDDDFSTEHLTRN